MTKLSDLLLVSDIDGTLIDVYKRQLCEGDVLSVRGYGKYLVAQVLSETKKGRLHLLCKKYV